MNQGDTGTETGTGIRLRLWLRRDRRRGAGGPGTRRAYHRLGGPHDRPRPVGFRPQRPRRLACCRCPQLLRHRSLLPAPARAPSRRPLRPPGGSTAPGRGGGRGRARCPGGGGQPGRQPADPAPARRRGPSGRGGGLPSGRPRGRRAVLVERRALRARGAGQRDGLRRAGLPARPPRRGRPRLSGSVHRGRDQAVAAPRLRRPAPALPAGAARARLPAPPPRRAVRHRGPGRLRRRQQQLPRGPRARPSGLVPDLRREVVLLGGRRRSVRGQRARRRRRRRNPRARPLPGAAAHRRPSQRLRAAAAQVQARHALDGDRRDRVRQRARRGDRPDRRWLPQPGRHRPRHLARSQRGGRLRADAAGRGRGAPLRGAPQRLRRPHSRLPRRAGDPGPDAAAHHGRARHHLPDPRPDRPPRHRPRRRNRCSGRAASR